MAASQRAKEDAAFVGHDSRSVICNLWIACSQLVEQTRGNTLPLELEFHCHCAYVDRPVRHQPVVETSFEMRAPTVLVCPDSDFVLRRIIAAS